MIRTPAILCALPLIFILGACAPAVHRSTALFPPSEQIFLTSGDGDIQRPYTPVGQLIYLKQGFRIPLPILGMLSIADIDPDYELRTEVLQEIRRLGGDAMINMEIRWEPPKNGLLGIGASGGHVAIYGTVITR